MTNADKFKNIFELYATELWSMPEKDFLKWLNSEAMNCSEIPNNSDTISRQQAIDAIRNMCEECDSSYCGECRVSFPGREDCEKVLKGLPSAQPEHKRGKWLINKGLYECSSCHQLWAEWWAISKPIERMKKECPYCPMCGSYNGEETEDVEKVD